MSWLSDGALITYTLSFAVQVGQILGAHGIKGEVKVRSSTDFAINRLCTPGIKHIKAPNRRFPRDVELLGGRWQKDEIFLLHIEVSRVSTYPCLPPFLTFH